MPSYIRSNSNRFYAAIESSYAVAAQITASNRFPATRLRAQQIVERPLRFDKTGTRTSLTANPDGTRRTGFELRTFLSTWTTGGQLPYGAFFQAAMGAVPETAEGMTVAGVSGPVTFTTETPHGRSVGSAISNGREIRFVTAVRDPNQLTVNAPFSNSIVSGTPLNTTITYRLATDLPTVSMYDYWDPTTAISRLLTGAAVNVMQISVMGDQHEFVFSGPAADLVDALTFSSGSAGLDSFPMEPSAVPTNVGAVPGHLGQAWLGGTASRFFTVTEASIQLQNTIELRNQDFGSSYPHSITPGTRQVKAGFSLFTRDDNQTSALYTAAKQRGTISMMLQMGKQKGQLMGVYLPSVTPALPAFDDSETRLRWIFKNNVAQGTADDELYIAFA
jgi:hypothetical protein